MKWIEARVTFEAENPALACELIAAVFYDLGVKGVVLEDPDPAPLADASRAQGTPLRPQARAIVGYFAATSGAPEKCRRLEAGLARLDREQALNARPAYRHIDEQDWAESWKRFFRPQRISARLVVKPSWRQYSPKPQELVIEIDPGMAFGTGTHPTTAGCLRLLEKHLRPRGSFLDVGTGSGILLIAASKLGATNLVGIDNDPVALAVARDNIVRNHICAEHCRIVAGNLLAPVRGRFDVVAANLFSETICTLLGDIARVLGPGGIFIGAGITAANRARVARRMAQVGMEIRDSLLEEDWVTLAGRMQR